MTIEAWIGLASLIATIAGVGAAIKYRPKASLADKHQEERRDALAALNDLETVLRSILIGTPMIRKAPDYEVLTGCIERLRAAALAAPMIARSVDRVVAEARVLRSTTSSIPNDSHAGYLVREWRRTDNPAEGYEPGPFLRRLAGSAAVQVLAAVECEKALNAAREALTT